MWDSRYMGTTTTLYRFQIELSDIQRGIYETLDFRVAQHPSEALPYLMTRVLAFALNSQEGLAFALTGLGDPDAAALGVPDLQGGFQTLIEIGNPSARKLHKATKTAKVVKVYTYKNPENMMKEIRDEKVHRAEEVEFFSFTPEFLAELTDKIKRDNRWSLLFDEGRLSIQIGEESVSGELGTHRL